MANLPQIYLVYKKKWIFLYNCYLCWLKWKNGLQKYNLQVFKSHAVGAYGRMVHSFPFVISCNSSFLL